jgi:hypothetical protein
VSSHPRRIGALVLVILVTAVATLFGAAAPAAAVPPQYAPSGSCRIEEWRDPANFDRCAGTIADLSQDRVNCVKAPTPNAPDSGMAGWFASRPDSAGQGPQGRYSLYGYAGYNYTTYDIGCLQTVMHPDYKFENTVANGEFMIATAIVGASNALRERAWNPKAMWGWADPLVARATKAIYDKVFTIFGAVTLAIVGLYLLWRSRQSDMSSAMTTAGWAVLIMIIVTAIAAWPTWSANVADKTLVGTLGVVHNAVGPPAQDCRASDPAACADHRSPATRASDTATDGLLYRNWLRGLLGSADSPTAQKYGPILYDAKSFTWTEIQDSRKDPDTRQKTIDEKAQHWIKVAEQIKTEDPEAYEYLQGTRGTDRIGAGFIAILSALFFALFDLTASVLVLLGFLLFRWAVIAAPILGTVGLLRPASSGIRRLANSVVAAVFNIVIFGTGAAIYLYAVDLIMGTTTLPGWLQVVLIWLTGVVGWLLLRPYRRITQLGGKDSSTAVTSLGSWHRRFFRDVRQTAALQVIEEGGTAEPVGGRRAEVITKQASRPESQRERGEPGADPRRPERPVTTEPVPARASDRRPESRGWSASEPEHSPTYAIFVPDSVRGEAAERPARRPEAAPVSR